MPPLPIGECRVRIDGFTPNRQPAIRRSIIDNQQPVDGHSAFGSRQ
jgi:hypothetical protein